MWRTALSMGISLAALVWPAIALLFVFLIVPALWELLFGPDGAVYGAIGAMVLVVWGTMKFTNWTDRLNGMADSKSSAAPVKVEPDVPANWPEYNAAIARNKRWAFYRRTHQFDRLRELDEEMNAARK
jgi:hypothetical protein